MGWNLVRCPTNPTEEIVSCENPHALVHSVHNYSHMVTMKEPNQHRPWKYIVNYHQFWVGTNLPQSSTPPFFGRVYVNLLELILYFSKQHVRGKVPRYLLVMATETISLLVLSRHGSSAEVAGLGLGHLGCENVWWYCHMLYIYVIYIYHMFFHIY